MRNKAAAPTTLPSGCWGKLNRGQRWFPMAIDFGRAVSVANLGGYERMLIHIIQERSWGKAGGDRDGAGKWPKAMPVPLTMKALAVELAGEDELTRKMIYRARKTLLESAVIRERDGGMVIETDISKWIGRIEPKFFTYCMEGRTKQAPKPLPNGAAGPAPARQPGAAGRNLEVTGSEDACHLKVPGCRAEVTNRNFKMTAPIDEAHAEEDSQKRGEEETDRQDAGLKIRDQDDWGLEDTDDLSGEIVAPVEPVDAILATDAPDGLPEPLPARPVSDEEREDDRLREWARAKALAATRDEHQAERVWIGVGYWRSMGYQRHEIAAYVAETCGINLPKVKTGVAEWVHGIFKKRQPDWSLPPVPPEWRPRPQPAPKIYRPSQDPMAIEELKAREAFQLAMQEAKRVSAAERDEADARVEELRRRMLAVMDARAARDRSAAPMGVAR